MSRPSRFKAADKHMIITMWKYKIPVRDIAAKFKVHTQTIYKLLTVK